MTQLYDQLTQSLDNRSRPHHRDPENQVVAMELPTQWNHGNLIMKVDDNGQLIDLFAVVGEDVPKGAQSLVADALQLANGYCKFGSFSLVSAVSRITLRSACIAVGGLPEAQSPTKRRRAVEHVRDALGRDQVLERRAGPSADHRTLSSNDTMSARSRRSAYALPESSGTMH